MSQFSFDGEFRRKPKQNFGGSSKISEQRDLILQKARDDRERRQRDRLVAKSIVVIQSCVRSFLIRCKLKKRWRAEFDQSKKAKYTEEEMIQQINRFTIFYDVKIDSTRLLEIVKLVLNYKQSILSLPNFNIYWQIRFNKLLQICVRSFNTEHTPPAVLLRLVNTLTDISEDNQWVTRWVASSWLNMIENANFFSEWRKFIESKIPPMVHPTLVAPTEMAVMCTSLLQRPFAILPKVKSLGGLFSLGSKSVDANTLITLILRKFTNSFCCNIIPVNENCCTVAYLVLPSLAQSFPWTRWIQLLNDTQESSTFTPQGLRNLLYAFLTLFQSNVLNEFADFDITTFLECLKWLLSSIDNRFAPLPNMSLSSYELGDDVDEEVMRTSEIDNYYNECNILYLKLRECINRVRIASWMDPFEPKKWEKLYPIISCIIRLEPKLASVHFHFLPALAYSRDFAKSAYLQMTASGSRTNEEISSFCWFFCHLIATLHDAEFVEGIPMHRNGLPLLVNYLKNLYNNFVIDDKDSTDPMVMSANKSVVMTLRGLHDRNTRIQMFPEEEFHSSFSMILPIDTHSIRFDEHLSIPSETRLPPLDMKLLRVLREFPYSMSFHDRVIVWNRMIHLDRGDRFQGLSRVKERIQIRRNFIYEDAYEKLSPDNVKNLRGLVRISLVNTVGALEAGVDGGGLLREFLIEATRAAVDPNRGLFRVDSQNRIYPNPIAKKIFPDFRNHFFLMGRLVGKALYEQTHLELPFAAFFIQTWITGNVASAVDYLATLDPSLHKNLLQLKEYKGDWNVMSIDFTITLDELGETRVIELKKNGKDISVDSTNIIEYIHLVADYKINREMEEECKCFRAGICDVIPLLHIFSWREMQTLISGSDKPIDLNDWAANVNYAGGFTAEHPTIVLFWQILDTFEEKDLRKLLKFVTSCSRPPLLGFKDLIPKFGIQNAGVTDRLPTASTCMNLLKLPELSSEKDLREKLLYVIAAEAGFELS